MLKPLSPCNQTIPSALTSSFQHSSCHIAEFSFMLIVVKQLCAFVVQNTQEILLSVTKHKEPCPAATKIIQAPPCVHLRLDQLFV
jgi:hypothetical protein